MIRDRGRAALLARIGAVALAVGLAAAGAAAALGMVLARRWEEERQHLRLESLLAVTAPDLGTACFLEDQSLAERVVADLLRSPDVRDAVLRTSRGVLADAFRPGRGPGPEPPPAWVRRIPSPFAKDTEVGQLTLTPEPGEVRRRAAAAAVLAAFGALAATLALVPALLLALHRLVARPLAALSRQAGRSEAGALLEPPPGHGNDAIGQLVWAINGMVRRVADAAWRVQEAGAAGPARPEPVRIAPEGTGVFLVRQDGTLEAWTPPLPTLLAVPGGPPPPGTRLAALFGPAAGQVEACLDECAREGRAAAVLPLGEPGAAATRWVHLVLERTGPGWIQGAVQDATGGMAALVRTTLRTGSGPRQEDPHAGALHGL